MGPVGYIEKGGRGGDGGGRQACRPSHSTSCPFAGEMAGSRLGWGEATVGGKTHRENVPSEGDSTGGKSIQGVIRVNK